MEPVNKLILAIIMGFFLFYCSADPITTYGAPKLTIKEQIFDFHEVMEGQILEHDFVIRNQGDQPLTIQDVKTG
ncbi:MAG: DUF1573 domain-containing protein [Desulfobacteraceae bacterium]|nr:MAG: DUF1573 domain-containing protein [Desulfobacteraceae bacterium]